MLASHSHPTHPHPHPAHLFPRPTSGSATTTTTPATSTPVQQQNDALALLLATATSSSVTTASARRLRGTHVWRIHNFSLLPRSKDKPINSPNFYAGDALWTIELYPWGVKDDGKLSIFVRLLDMPGPDKDKPFLPVKYRFRVVSLTGLPDYAPIDWEQRNWLLDHEWGYLSLPREAIYEYSVDDSVIFVLDLDVTVGLTVHHQTSTPSYTELRLANQDLLGRDMSTLIRQGIKTDVKIVLRKQSSPRSLTSTPTPTQTSSSTGWASSPHTKRRRTIPETGGKGTLDENDGWENDDSDEVVIPAHKLILSMRSPIFHAMFNHDMKENAENIIYIDDMDRLTLLRMLEYIYTSNVQGHPPRDWSIDTPRSRDIGPSTTSASTSTSYQHPIPSVPILTYPISSRYEQGNASTYAVYPYTTSTYTSSPSYTSAFTTTATYPTTSTSSVYPSSISTSSSSSSSTSCSSSSSSTSSTSTSTSTRKRSRDDEDTLPPIQSWDEVMSLFRAADKYVLEGLSNWCGYLVGKFLTNDNCLATIQLADRYRTCVSGSAMIKRIAKEYLMSSFDDVIDTIPYVGTSTT